MAPVNIKYIVSFSSQDDCHKANNLITSDGSKVWLSDRKDKSGKSEVILQLEKPSQLAFLDIGAVWCATLEVRVGRSDWPQTAEYKPLISTCMMMSPLDCRLNRGVKSTQMFSPKDFSQEVAREFWDRLHIICRQPYRRDVQFGLSFIQIRNASTAVPPGNLSAPVDGVSPVDKPVIGVSSIQKHFFGDVKKNGDSPTDRLKYRLMKMAGSTENGCEQEQALSRSAKLVLTASETQKAYSPARTSSPGPRNGLFSEHLARKNDVPISEEMKAFLQTQNLAAADIDTVTIADLRHRLERRKRRKLTKEERRTFSEICQDFFYDLFDNKIESNDSNNLTPAVGSKGQSDLLETRTVSENVSVKQVQGKSDGRMLGTFSRKRARRVNQTGCADFTDVADFSDDAEMNCNEIPKCARLNDVSDQVSCIQSPTTRNSANKNSAVNESLAKTFVKKSESQSLNDKILAGEKKQHLDIVYSRDLLSHEQKLSPDTGFYSPFQEKFVKRRQQKAATGNNCEDKIDSGGVISEPFSDIDRDCVHDIDKTKTLASCGGSDQDKTHGSDQDQAPASVISRKPTKLKQLSKASFDIFQEFSMEVMGSDDDVSNNAADDEGNNKLNLSASERQSFKHDSKHDSLSECPAKSVDINSVNEKSEKRQHKETEQTMQTPKSTKGKIYRMRTSRHKLNASHTGNESNVEHAYRVSTTSPGACDLDRLDTSGNQNCLEYSSCKAPDQVRMSRRKMVVSGMQDDKIRISSDMNVTVPILTKHSRDSLNQVSRTRGQETELSRKIRAEIDPSELLQDTFCERYQGQYPAGISHTHTDLCSPGGGKVSPPEQPTADGAKDCGECPICLQKFPQDVLLLHASDCGL